MPDNNKKKKPTEVQSDEKLVGKEGSRLIYRSSGGRADQPKDTPGGKLPPSKTREEFNRVYAAADKADKPEFTWRGKKYKVTPKAKPKYRSETLSAPKPIQPRPSTFTPEIRKKMKPVPVKPQPKNEKVYLAEETVKSKPMTWKSAGKGGKNKVVAALGRVSPFHKVRSQGEGKQKRYQVGKKLKNVVTRPTRDPEARRVAQGDAFVGKGGKGKTHAGGASRSGYKGEKAMKGRKLKK